ncbi:polysaccharide deacetylase family protein [Deinococcus sp. HMF7604]|uniref:YkoP family protein n=1 Tax=Deinococcus betulae TaxID=2873312 RepID=UPI001CCE5B22|nr:polysaccharide deacetylase family protein [Deinococcus betulae]MBZ9753284.1 polysaccharide deacetylase family protein [Deinococcus betulae]
MGRVAGKLGRWALGLGALLWGAGRLWRWTGVGTLRRARSAQPGLGLVFEGGPDPQTTPALLAALKAAGAQATFCFEAGAIARAPALAQQAAAEGHDLRPFVPGGPLTPPWTLARLRQAQAGLTALTGQPPHAFRAAAGVPALWVALMAQQTGLRPIAGQGNLAQGRRPGALLHLSGTDPQVARALPAHLTDLQARGYEVRALSGLRHLRPDTLRDIPATALQLVDVIYDRLGRIRRIGGHASSLFRVGTAPYPLADITLPAPDQPAGLTLGRGQRVAEFHLDSARLVELAERPVAGRRVVTHSIHDLAAALRDDPDWQTLDAVFSISIFADVLGIYGFTVVDLPPAHRRRLTWWSRTLRRAYGVSDPEKAHTPRLAMIARTELLRRYGTRRSQ